MLLPTSRAAVADEFRRVLRPPFEVPAALVGNALLMTLAWFLLPPAAHDWLFSLHGPLAFPVIMASWMLGDTPATNIAGLDADKALSVLHDTTAFRGWLLARTLVLASLVGLPTILIALACGFEGQPVLRVVATCVVLAVLPLGILPVAAWLGLLLPYRLRPLRWRWDHRREWRGAVRWVLLIVAPLVLVPMVASVVLFPSLVLARTVFDAPRQPLDDAEFVVCAVSICGTALLAGLLGLWGARHLQVRRRHHLARYLRDPAAS